MKNADRLIQMTIGFDLIDHFCQGSLASQNLVIILGMDAFDGGLNVFRIVRIHASIPNIWPALISSFVCDQSKSEIANHFFVH